MEERDIERYKERDGVDKGKQEKEWKKVGIRKQQRDLLEITNDQIPLDRNLSLFDQTLIISDLLHKMCSMYRFFVNKT